MPLYIELDPMQEPKSGPSFFFQLEFKVKDSLRFFDRVDKIDERKIDFIPTCIILACSMYKY